jgi:hypothetical protein
MRPGPKMLVVLVLIGLAPHYVLPRMAHATARSMSVLTSKASVAAALSMQEPPSSTPSCIPSVVPDQYVVVLQEGTGSYSEVADQLAEQYGLIVRNIFPGSADFTADILPEAVAAVRADSRVAAVVPNYVVPRPTSISGTAAGDMRRPAISAVADAGAQSASNGLKRIGGSVDGVHQTLANKGSGIGIAIVDTGIAPHRDLTSVVRPGVTCAPDGSQTSDTLQYDDPNGTGHGTGVAGIIGAVDNEIDLVGVAPSAAIYPVKVYPDGKRSRRVSGWGCG